jgi:hypothetical protein
VQLINTEGMAFIGPGSEWFWTALGGIALTVTFVAIYRQVRLQRGAVALEHLTSLKREWDSEAMARSALETLLEIQCGCDLTHLPVAAHDVADFWQRVGYMVRTSDVDRRLVHQYLSSEIRDWWMWLAPTVRAWRETEGPADLYGHFEWLAGLMAEMDRRTGRVITFDEAAVARSLEAYIEISRHQIRLGEELRSVVVRPGSPAGLTLEPVHSSPPDERPVRRHEHDDPAGS